MSQPIGRLRIGGVEVPIEAHYGACNVTVERHASGRRKLALTAAGRYAPDLSGVTWTAGVLVEWRDLADAEFDWQGITLLSAGPQVQDDLSALGTSWSLSGWEVPAGTVTVTVGGVTTLGTVETAPIGGAISAWRRVTVSGESATAPTVSAGSVAVTSAVFTGSILSSGLTVSRDPETALYRWSVTGVELSGATTAVTVGGVTGYGSVRVSPIGGRVQRRSNGAGTMMRAWNKRTVQIRGAGAAAPTVTAGVAAVTTALYTGNLLVAGLEAEIERETGLVLWSLSGEEP